jgi:ubiquinone/menaquinone biosynthesis C-methylase UbiE
MPTQHDPENIEIKYLHEVAQLANAHVLEIGSGEGRLTWRYAVSARRITAIDPDPIRLIAAQRECPPALRSKVAFVQVKAETLPFPREKFDLAILSWSL